jgi:hypothetical protein
LFTYNWHKLFYQYLKLLISNYNLTKTQCLIAWLNSQIFTGIGVNVPLLLSDGTIDGVNICVHDIEAQFSTALDFNISEDTAHCALTFSVCLLVTYPEDNNIAGMPYPHPVAPAITLLLAGSAIVESSPQQALSASLGLLFASSFTIVELSLTATAASLLLL